MIAPTPFFADRGCHTQIYREITGLQNSGHEVVLCTYGLGRDMPGIRTIRTANFPWYKKLSAGPSYTKVLLLPLLTVTSFKAIISFKPDIVHAHLHEGAIIAKICSLFFRSHKYIFEFQGSLQKETLNHNFVKESSIFYKFLGWLESKILSWQYTVVGSPVMFEEVKSMKGIHPDRVANIGYSVNTERFTLYDYPKELADSLGIKDIRDTVLYMGLLEEYQGIDIMFKAFRIVSQKRPRTQFVIIGYPNIDKYKRICESYGISEHVVFLGKIDYNEIPLYLSLAKIAAAPKISVTEGDGKLYDYMAMGMAIVAFDRNVSRSIMGNCGIYAEFASAESLAEKIIWLLDNPQEIQRYGLLARERAVIHHSSKAMIARLENIYQHL